MSYKNIILQNRPIAYWRLEETGGNVAADETGNFNGTWHGSPNQGVGGIIIDQANNPVGKAARFSDSDWIEANPVTASISSSPFSLEAWFSDVPENSAAYILIATNLQDYENGLLFYIQEQKMIINGSTADGGSFLHPAGPVVTGPDRHHAVVTWDLSNFVVYLDGTPIIDETISFRPIAATDYFSIGQEYDAGEQTGNFFNGILDEIAVYDKALNADQIKTHFNAGLGLDTSSVSIRRMDRTRKRIVGAPAMENAIRRRHFTKPMAKQQYYGGPGQITGTTVDKNNVPISRKVLLYDRRSHILLRSTWSNAAGAYSFKDLDPDREYTLIGHDYSDEYNGVIADNVTPEVV